MIATMQCAGNRRAHLQGVEKTSGDPWDVGAIGNAEWTGVSLRDVLAAAGIQDGASFVGTTGADNAGVRSAKWLTRIEVRDRPSDAPIQAKD
jgi:sulfite oxidase